jgi:hypothetical protein
MHVPFSEHFSLKRALRIILPKIRIMESPIDAVTLSRTLEEFFASSPNSVVIEEGRIAFDLTSARYSISNGNGKCLLHMWSEEGNAVRRVVKAEHKNYMLCLTVHKFGKAKPHVLEICPTSDRRTPSAKKTSRVQYHRTFERTLLHHFSTFELVKLRSTMDLEHSFSPVYARALLYQGRRAIAALGVGNTETQSSIDGALTFGLIWLEHCRQVESLKAVVEGLHLFVPKGSSAVVRARAAYLDHKCAKFRIYELEEDTGMIQEFDLDSLANLETRLVRCPDGTRVRERFAGPIAKVKGMVPDCDAVVLSSAEVSFRFHGLEFARARIGGSENFRTTEEVTFGAGANAITLTPETEHQLRELTRRLVTSRRVHNPQQKRDALWRMSPERWLESVVLRDISRLDTELDPTHVYSQVPAFSAGDRAMIDVLAARRDGRLAVIELKADEDIHLPMQGLDYWARVHWHHQRKEFAKFNYFNGRTLAPDPPQLVLVAPALRVHPTTDKLLKYLSPKIDFVLLGVDERWRDGVRVVFRKRRKDLKN